MSAWPPSSPRSSEDAPRPKRKPRAAWRVKAKAWDRTAVTGAKSAACSSSAICSRVNANGCCREPVASPSGAHGVRSWSTSTRCLIAVAARRRLWAHCKHCDSGSTDAHGLVTPERRSSHRTLHTLSPFSTRSCCRRPPMRSSEAIVVIARGKSVCIASAARPAERDVLPWTCSEHHGRRAETTPLRRYTRHAGGTHEPESLLQCLICNCKKGKLHAYTITSETT